MPLAAHDRAVVTEWTDGLRAGIPAGYTRPLEPASPDTLGFRHLAVVFTHEY